MPLDPVTVALRSHPAPAVQLPLRATEPPFGPVLVCPQSTVPLPGAETKPERDHAWPELVVVVELREQVPPAQLRSKLWVPPDAPKNLLISACGNAG